ncbi:hypothetical protein HHL19_14855 [Streptomyces sp. R302]|uniref:hypothetical protein n=1 Tax=unclassified Streptomyces TaxID=2593676 RepID=UPI00145CA9E9|nr:MULTISPECIES: hypothetical protein [unclassified Streptomyces]NML51352.1 hypothetical protein [Streptomyces sp. R301]NML79930.1 hypothetical protein [Streptomyces sp. R302]
MTHRGGAGDAGVVDADKVMRARVFLLGSGRLDQRQELEAYRVLAPVSPAVYAPKLVRRLDWTRATTPERREELAVEGVAAARLLDPAHPQRTEVLCRALGRYGSELLRQGRRAEALAFCRESAAVGREGYERGQVDHPRYGAGQLITVLSEEGRYADALEASNEEAEDDFWAAVRGSALREAAGRSAEAVAAFGRFLAEERTAAAEGRTALAILVWSLLRQAEVLDRAGRGGEAGEHRREAGEALARLAADGEPVSWSNIQNWWVTLFLLSGRPDEPPAAPGALGPPFGEDARHWSPDTQEAFAASTESLEAEKAALTARTATDPARWLPELLTAHRRLTLRAALRVTHRTHRILDPLRPLLDEGGALARRLSPTAEARALTDRSTMLLAAHAYEEAHKDFTTAETLRAATPR